MPATIVWPAELLTPATFVAHPIGRSTEGLMPLSGASPSRITFGRGGVWGFELGKVMLPYPRHQRAWKALRAQQQNGSAPLVLPYFETCLRLRSLGGSAPVGHSDGAAFADGALYRGASIAAYALDDADHGATEMRLRVLNAQPLGGAEPFSINHAIVDWRLYEVESVLEATPVSGGFDYRIAFGLPLRQAIAAGQEIEFDRPRCVVKLAAADGMKLEERWCPEASVMFVEDMSALSGLSASPE